jgi:hypothetical protein
MHVASVGPSGCAVVVVGGTVVVVVVVVGGVVVVVVVVVVGGVVVVVGGTVVVVVGATLGCDVMATAFETCLAGGGTTNARMSPTANPPMSRTVTMATDNLSLR